MVGAVGNKHVRVSIWQTNLLISGNILKDLSPNWGKFCLWELSFGIKLKKYFVFLRISNVTNKDAKLSWPNPWVNWNG